MRGSCPAPETARKQSPTPPAPKVSASAKASSTVYLGQAWQEQNRGKDLHSRNTRIWIAQPLSHGGSFSVYVFPHCITDDPRSRDLLCLGRKQDHVVVMHSDGR